MDLQDWNRAGTRRPDYRRYTVAEGGTPLPLGATAHRKRLRSVGEEDGEGPRSCNARPNPEGSGQEEAEPGSLCQRCHIMAAQLHRQAAALADPAALKDPVYAAFLLDKLQRLQWPRRGHHPSADARCDVCSTSFHQLRRVALRRALGISPAFATSTPHSSTASDLLRERAHWSDDETQMGGAPWGWGGVQSTYLGGGGAKRLATVTPLSTTAERSLEGVWRVSCHAGYQQTGLSSDGERVTSKVSTHSIATQTVQPPSAAAAFFHRAAQKLSLSRRKKSCPGPPSPSAGAPGPLLYTGGFSGALQLSPPAVPPCLLRAGSKVKDTPGMGKVRVMVRICSVNSGESPESTSFLKVDSRKKQLSLCESAGSGAQRRCSAPKTFTFDAVFTQDSSQAEVCSGTLTEVLQSVVNGADGCIFCYGHADLGKTYTMIGRDCSTQSLGVAPTAISWLFKVMEERSEKVGASFSLRVSAVEVSGREEALTDLLAEVGASFVDDQQAAPGPAVALHHDPVCGSQLQNQTELLAASAERAAFFLDAALAARRSSHTPGGQELRRNSHFLFTLHLLQERLEKSSKAAVSRCSRLHLLDLGSCETDASRTREGGGAQCLSLSGLGNVVLALANGAKHVPYRDSKLTMLLSQSLGNINCRTTMIAHVCDTPLSFMETLSTLQLTARIHRLRRKKKRTSSSSGGESSCEEGPSNRPRHPRPFHPRTVALDPDSTLLLCADPDCSSSSEHSCDTVIYVGRGGVAGVSDQEPSDGEAPPSFVPIIPSLNKKPLKAPLRSEGERLKCNTFAELQERLDCIDGNEVLRSQTEPDSHGVRQKPHLEQGSAIHQSSMNEEKLCAAIQEPEGHEKVYFRGCVPKPSASPSLPRALVSRSPLVGVSHQSLTPCPPAEPSWHLEGGLLRTTIRLQQPLELSGEDELVFTVMEEIPQGFFPDNGWPVDQAPGRTSRPVSIISSINDQYDSLTSQSGFGSEAAISWRAEVSTGPINLKDENMQMLPETDILSDSDTAAQNQPHHSQSPGSPGPTKAFQTPLTLGQASATILSSLSTKTTATSSPPRPDLLRGSNLFEPRDAEILSEVNKNGSGTKRLAGGSSIPLLPRGPAVAQRVANSRERSDNRYGDAPGKLQRLTRGATTLGMVSGPHSPESRPGPDGSPQSESLRKKSIGQKCGGTVSAIAPPFRQSSHEPKMRMAQTPRETGRASSPKTWTSEEEIQVTAVSFSHKTGSLKTDHGRSASSLRRRAAQGVTSLDRSHTHTGTRITQDKSVASPGPNHRPSRSAPRPGVSAGSAQLKCSSSSLQAAQSAGSKVRSPCSNSKSQSSVPRPADPGFRRSTGPPATTGTLDPPFAAAKSGRGAVMSLKPGVSRAASSRVSELTVGKKQVGGGGALVGALPSPYSTVTAPRRPPRHSSGHASDTSSVLSGELPPAMGRTALFYHSGCSSGYESMIRDSETTGSTSSAHDSTSDSGAAVVPPGRSRNAKSPRRRGNGFLRRRLIPAPLPDASSLGRKGQWAEIPQLSGALKEPFEIKVYEIDDVTHFQKSQELGIEPFHDVEGGLLYFNARLRMLERRQQQIRELKVEHEHLKSELLEAQQRLMVEPGRWRSEFEVDQDLDCESQAYLEALARVSVELRRLINLCKSRVMMETCFDITMTTVGSMQEA